MQQQSLYVISVLGQDRFVWAASATEARAKASATWNARPAETVRAHADTYANAHITLHAPHRPSA